jgi:hypothetical protein
MECSPKAPTFGETCSECGGDIRIIPKALAPLAGQALASIEDPAVIQKILTHLDSKLSSAATALLPDCRASSRPKRVLTPLNGTHRAVVMAIERGKLQNLIFDNHVLWSHRAMAGILGVILKLPPIKRVLVSKQLKSRYLEALINYVEH